MFKLKSVVKRTGIIYGRAGMEVKFVDGISEDVDEKIAKYFGSVPGYEIIPGEAKGDKEPSVDEGGKDEKPSVEVMEPEVMEPEVMEPEVMEPEVMEPEVIPGSFDEAAFRAAHFRSQVRMIKNGEVPDEFLTVIVDEPDNFSPSILKEAEDRLKEVFGE